jgi:anthranilate phosphoribosyltransferase
MLAEILQRLGRESAWVVHGTTESGGVVDELSLMGSTRICKSGAFQDFDDEEVRPRDVGLPHADLADLKGGDAKTNARILESILNGDERGPKRDMVLLNAGAAIACSGLADDLGSGIEQARAAIDSGGAYARLEKLREVAG